MKPMNCSHSSRYNVEPFQCDTCFESLEDTLKREHNEALHDYSAGGTPNDECPFCNGSDDEGNTWGDDGPPTD